MSGEESLRKIRPLYLRHDLNTTVASLAALYPAPRTTRRIDNLRDRVRRSDLGVLEPLLRPCQKVHRHL